MELFEKKIDFSHLHMTTLPPLESTTWGTWQAGLTRKLDPSTIHRSAYGCKKNIRLYSVIWEPFEHGQMLFGVQSQANFPQN